MPAISEIGLIAAFAAGMISFLSPCVLPLVPGYVSYVSGTTVSNSGLAPAVRLPALLPSVCFVLGFSSVFVALGASATLLSRILLAYRHETNMLGGAIGLPGLALPRTGQNVRHRDYKPRMGNSHLIWPLV